MEFICALSVVGLVVVLFLQLSIKAKKQQEKPAETIQILEDEYNEVNNQINQIEELSNKHEISKTDTSLCYDITLNSVIDSNIPNNVEELTNNHYEVLKRLNGANIKYALTGIINAYHSNLSDLLRKFKELELIRYSNLEEAMQKITIKELKEYLRNKKLKLTGNKKDLTGRLLPNLNEEEKKRILVQNKCYVLTKKGNQILEEYKNKKENEEQNIFKQTINLIKQQDITQAYNQICEYNIKYNSIGGINFDWKQQLQEGINKIDYEAIKWFMSKDLNINSKITESDFKAIICFEYLSGKSYNDIIRLIKDVYNQNEDITNIQYYNSILSNEREALELENLDMKYYEILATDNSCNRCSSKAHKKLKLSERKVGINFPPICKECRCTIVAYFDEDA